MASKTDIVAQLDELFGELIQKTKGDQCATETKLEVFKEGIRWAGVKNKIPEEGGPTTPEGGRLGKFKRGLRR